MSFTTFAFDGLRRRSRSASRGFGRIKAGTKRTKERVCGCTLGSVPRKGGGRQPVLSCPGTPMKRFVSQADASRMRGKRDICTTMLKPLK